MKPEQVKDVVEKIKQVKIAVYGDFCLDAYWHLNPKGGEISVETALQAQAVERHYYSLGGASNVVANLAALEPAVIKVIGVIGDDIFGRELKLQLESLGVDTSTLIVQKENFNTVTFGKRYLKDAEQPRIDFGFFNARTKETDDIILKNIKAALENFDCLIFNQQVPGSLNNEDFIRQVNTLFDKFDDKIVLFDSRHYGNKFTNVYRKTNDIEAARLNGIDAQLDDVIDFADIKLYARKLYDRSNKPVFVTRGPRGLLVADSEGIGHIPGIQLLKKLDTVGAGDTTISALGLCLAAGLSPRQAAEFANFAAAVTVQKLFQTGTASPKEVIEISRDADYIYQPQLADDIRTAEYLDSTEIEICCGPGSVRFGNIKHAVFDHDGTISTLRQNWEAIMEPVMVKAVLGSQYETASETLYNKVLARVRSYIDKSTGIQTILQMQALVEMVREFDIVPSDKILDKFGYKKVYNEALMEMVNRRLEKFKTGQLNINDYVIKGSVDFLKTLRKRNITLYLASGTDRGDVINEAAVLGYADLFNGGTYGAIGDITKYSKKMVLENIMNENNLEGCQLAVFGDGPVEIRECRKRDGIAIGIASDEVRRYGLNTEKRSRLIKAGAHIIIPDFSQADKLLELLFSG